MKNNTDTHLPLVENIIPALIVRWQSIGYSFGVDDHLRLRELLQQYTTPSDVVALKYLLAPLFADNAQQQEAFYEIFDEVINNVENELFKHEERIDEIYNKTAFKKITAFSNKITDSWYAIYPLYKWLVFSLLCGVIAFTFYYADIEEKEDQDTVHSQLFITTSVGVNSNFCLQNNDSKYGAIKSITPLSPPTSVVDIQYKIDEQGICFNDVTIKAGREVMSYSLCYNSGDCQRFDLIYRVDNGSNVRSNYTMVLPQNLALRNEQIEEKNTADVTIETEKTLPPHLSSINTELDTMLLSSDPSRAVDGVQTKLRFGQGGAYFSWKKFRWILTLFGLFLLLVWWGNRRRQKFSIGHQPNKDYPYTWSIRIPSLKKVDLGKAFDRNLLNMLHRDKKSSQNIDLPKTIKTSLKQGGAIDFQYLQLKESRQYLFLIDVSTQNNHRTKILDYFIKALQKEDAPIEYFLFDKDPRSCWNDKSPEGISLKHLAHIYQSHQLILCSDGKVLLNAESENLVNWIKIFDAWRKKLLLTPKVYKDWNIKEQTLSEKFRMLPCTPNGITYLVDALESVEALDYEKLGYSQEEEVYQNITIPSTWQEEQLIRYLEAEFVKAQNGKTDDTLLRWIAACSIPPILFWQWTFYIGQLLSDSINNRLSLEHLFQIARISWFSEGKMPEQVRLILINWLEKKYPDWLDSLRKEWNSILNLEENLPPPNSVAWDGHRIEVILNQLLQNSSWRKKRALELELDRLMLGQKDQDAMVIQYLKKRYDALEAVLSNRFRQFIQKKENLFWRFRMWVWQVPVFLILLLSSVLTHYSVPVTTFKFNNYISAMTFSEDGEYFFVANGRGGLAVCETNGEWKQGLAEQKSSILALSNGIDDNQIQAGFSDNTIVHWDISGVPLLLYKNEERLIRDVAFHPNNDKIALLAFAKNRAELWNIKTNELLLTLQHSENVTHAVNSVAFAPNGTMYLTGSEDNTAKLWDTNGNLLETFDQHTDKIHSVAFSNSGRYIATGSRDNTAKIWNLNAEVLHTLNGKLYDVFKVEFSPDDTQLVTAHRDFAAILWSVETGQQKRKFKGHRNYVTSATFSPDGKLLLTGDRDGVVRLWTLNEE